MIRHFDARRDEGIGSFLGKTVAGRLGGWNGSPLAGHWLFKIDQISAIPAVLGCQ